MLKYHLTSMTALIVALAATSACSAPVESGEPVGSTSSRIVSGAMAVTHPSEPVASETATIVNKNDVTGVHKVVAFNFDDPVHVINDAIGRKVYPGAVGVGWNYATGGTNNDPFTSVAKRLPAPPSGWAMLWADPGLGQLLGTKYVYLTVLSVPQSRVPSQGYIGGSMFPFIGGGCVARSSNGGVSFTVAASDCLPNGGLPNGASYDGSDIVGVNGAVFAAFRLYDPNRRPSGGIEVWRAGSATAGFSKLPDPFPGKLMQSHPRMIAAGNVMYLIAGDADANIWLQAYSAGAWAANPLKVGTNHYKQEVQIGSSTFIRRDGQYDLAYSPGYIAVSSIRVFYTKKPADHVIIKGTLVQTGIASIDLYSIDPGVDVFHPAMANATVSNPPPTPGWSNVTAVTWMQETSPGRLAIYSAQPATNMTGTLLTGSTPPCPDQGNYWGDYDAHLGVYQADQYSRPRFWRAFSDSTDANGLDDCSAPWPSYSKQVSVSAVSVQY